MALTLLRHGEPLVAGGTCYGQSDIPARAFDGASIRALLAALPRAIARIDTSPLARCSMLAEQVGKMLGLPVHTDRRLMEIDFGCWEMRAWDDIPRHEIDAWAQDVTGARPHGGESVAQMTGRVRAYLREAASYDGNILAVTHLGVVRCAGDVLGHPKPFEIKLGFGQFLTIEPKDAA